MKKKLPKNSKFNEPLMVYQTTPYTPFLATASKEDKDQIDFDLPKLVHLGVSKKALQELAKKTMLTNEEMSGILHIPLKTIHDYTQDTLLRKQHANIAIELAILYKCGIDVIGNITAFNVWMRSPNLALGNDIPLSLLQAPIGFDRILQVLGRLEHGVFS